MYDDKYQFVLKSCPRPDHYCNGQAIPDRPGKLKDIGVCQYYDIEKGCTHKSNPGKEGGIK